MANIEAFRQLISSSINLLFLKSVNRVTTWTEFHIFFLFFDNLRDKNDQKYMVHSLISFIIRCISFSYPNYNDIVRKRLQVIITDSNSVVWHKFDHMTAINKAFFFFKFSRQKYLFLDNCCCFCDVKPCFNAEFIIFIIIISWCFFKKSAYYRSKCAPEHFF